MTTAPDALRLTRVPVASKGQLIRRPPAEVFQAFVDPRVTTRFWFTRSSGPLAPGAKVQWDWEMYGASASVAVKDFEENRRLVFEWGGGGQSSTVELRFVPWQEHTYVQVTESGFSGSGDEVAAKAVDSAGGFGLILAAAKALLEHGVVLTVVLDLMPKGLKL